MILVNSGNYRNLFSLNYRIDKKNFVLTLFSEIYKITMNSTNNGADDFYDVKPEDVCQLNDRGRKENEYCVNIYLLLYIMCMFGHINFEEKLLHMFERLKIMFCNLS